MKQRLHKILSQAGIASRRAAEKIMLEKRVRVNGRIVDQLGFQADPSMDRITVDGKPIRRERSVYLIMNKPKGYICSLKDTIGRRTVKELLPHVNERIYPVGRLDYNSEGILFFTNDGDIAQKLMHPSHSVKKQYLVKIKGTLSGEDLERIRQGIYLSDGKTHPADVREMRKNGNSWIRMTISEGKKNQIRRIFQQLRHPVMKLRRIAFGCLKLGRLPLGMCRFLSHQEIKSLRDLVE